MKYLINNLLFFTGRLSSFFLYRTIRMFKFCFIQIYSGWIGQQFKTIGSKPLIDYPIHLVGGKFISIGENFTSGKRFRLNAYDEFNNEKYSPSITFGDNININDDCHIACIEKIEIGNNVLVAGKVFISDHLHGTTNFRDLHIPPSLRPLSTKGGVIIEDSVWIGENVSILPGVIIGKGSIIGANAVVTKSVPPYSIAIGIPARIIETKEK